MLKTEKRNESSMNIDTMTSLQMADVMQRANQEAVLAVEAVKTDIANVIDNVSKRMKNGGRLFYIGCGTSGRLGVLDASECPPTFGVSKDLVVGVIAGGDYALRNAVEAVEDNYEAGKDDIKLHNITENDSVIGISVAGNAQYVVGALEYANSVSAYTVALTCNEDCSIVKIAKSNIITDTGAEIVTGSTRMKAGTAHKMVLNMISTGVMIKLGRVLENYMIYIKPMNKKLRKRMLGITSELLKCSEFTAEELLIKNDWDIKSAVEAYKNGKQ